LSDDIVDEGRESSGDGLSQLGAPLRGTGLHAEDHDFAGRLAEQLKGDHQIGETELVYGRFAGKTAQGGAFETEQGSDGFSGIDGIDYEKSIDSGDVRQERETLRAAVEQYDTGRDAGIKLKALDGMDADAVVGVNEIAESEDRCQFHKKSSISSAAC